MTAAAPRQVAARRLSAQRLAQSELASPREIVSAFGAMQAQDLAGSRWAVGLRGKGLKERDVEQALDSGELVRTHALRGTWHLVAPEDVRWLLGLVGPRVLSKLRGRREQLGLTDAVLEACGSTLRAALEEHDALDRAEVRRVLKAAKVPLRDEGLSHVLMHAELTGLVCSGPRRGKQQTYALLDARVPSTRRRFTGDEAVAELARRYFSSRGPALLDDFSWWSGLTLGECRRATQSIAAELVEGPAGHFRTRSAGAAVARKRSAHLVPSFDEYLVAYRDRTAVVDPAHARRVNGGGGMLNPCVLLDGRVVGLWKRTLRRAGVSIELHLFERTGAAEEQQLTAAAERYAAFLGLEPELRLSRMQGSLGANGRWMFAP